MARDGFFGGEEAPPPRSAHSRVVQTWVGWTHPGSTLFCLQTFSVQLDSEGKVMGKWFLLGCSVSSHKFSASLQA